MLTETNICSVQNFLRGNTGQKHKAQHSNRCAFLFVTTCVDCFIDTTRSGDSKCAFESNPCSVSERVETYWNANRIVFTFPTRVFHTFFWNQRPKLPAFSSRHWGQRKVTNSSQASPSWERHAYKNFAQHFDQDKNSSTDNAASPLCSVQRNPGRPRLSAHQRSPSCRWSTKLWRTCPAKENAKRVTFQGSRCCWTCDQGGNDHTEAS